MNFTDLGEDFMSRRRSPVREWVEPAGCVRELTGNSVVIAKWLDFAI